MKYLLVVKLVLCIIFINLVKGLNNEIAEVCCKKGEALAFSHKNCSVANIHSPASLNAEENGTCLLATKYCCQLQLLQIEECSIGIKIAAINLCDIAKTSIGGACCNECKYGRKVGETYGNSGCGIAIQAKSVIARYTFLKNNAFYQCCMNAADESGTTVGSKEETTGPTQERCDARINSCEHICAKEHGVEQCYCKKGYTLHSDGKSCKDIDECALKIDYCEDGQLCVNTLGSFKCTGRPVRRQNYSESVYHMKEELKATESLNSPVILTTMPLSFTPNTLITPSPTSKIPYTTKYTIIVDSNIGPNSDEVGTEVLEYPMEITTEETTPKIEQIIGSTNTTTPTDAYGRTPLLPSETPTSTEEHTETDADECERNNLECGLLQSCEEIDGEYSCQCPHGYNSFDKDCEDIDECNNYDKCPDNSDCVNTEGSFNCECSEGYRENTENLCEDVDECTEDPSVCEQGCTNTIGGYNCSCMEGYRLEDGVCTDIDECSESYSMLYGPTCAGTCDNFPGSFTCMCPEGYRLSNDKRNCTVYDGCASIMLKCGQQQHCEKVDGQYSCQCPPGYNSYGKNCEDINECNQDYDCPADYHCVNTEGSYNCVCSEGFRKAFGGTCDDVDECAEDPGICEHRCTNTYGAYTCDCFRGYRLEDGNCVDINECEENNDLLYGPLCVGTCINTPGYYYCTCPTGYRLTDNRNCTDINECVNGVAICGNEEGDNCINLHGSYHCEHINCPSGYTIHGVNLCIRNPCISTLDWACQKQPNDITYNFISIPSLRSLPNGHITLTTVMGPSVGDSYPYFSFLLVAINGSPIFDPANYNCFKIHTINTLCSISLHCNVQGPQAVEMELTMSLYTLGQTRKSVSKIMLLVSEHDF